MTFADQLRKGVDGLFLLFLFFSSGVFDGVFASLDDLVRYILERPYLIFGESQLQTERLRPFAKSKFAWNESESVVSAVLTPCSSVSPRRLTGFGQLLPPISFTGRRKTGGVPNLVLNINTILPFTPPTGVKRVFGAVR